MLKIFIEGGERFDPVTNEFRTVKDTYLQLEHSLVSISKWEAKWHKPFLGKDDKTAEEIIDYVKCMTITQNVDPEIYNHLTQAIMNEISEYIADPMTATWFSKDPEKKGASKTSNETITSELIYYWMIALQVPVEFQKWHLNRLLTLIRVCNIKNQPPKKMSKAESLARSHSINAARRAAARK